MAIQTDMYDLWLHNGTVDQEKLEQFATSIAAMATHEATPLAILGNVLNTIAENLNASTGENRYNAETILQERAQELGFEDVPMFRREIVRLVGQRIIDLEVSKLSAYQRQIRQKRELSA